MEPNQIDIRSIRPWLMPVLKEEVKSMKNRGFKARQTYKRGRWPMPEAVSQL